MVRAAGVASVWAGCGLARADVVLRGSASALLALAEDRLAASLRRASEDLDCLLDKGLLPKTAGRVQRSERPILGRPTRAGQPWFTLPAQCRSVSASAQRAGREGLRAGARIAPPAGRAKSGRGAKPSLRPSRRGSKPRSRRTAPGTGIAARSRGANGRSICRGSPWRGSNERGSERRGARSEGAPPQPLPTPGPGRKLLPRAGGRPPGPRGRCSKEEGKRCCGSSPGITAGLKGCLV